MAKKSKNVGDELVLVAKAIRRAEKLERTLAKLVVLQEPGGAAEAFLKSVQKGIERLHKDEIPAASDGARKGRRARVATDAREESPAEIISRPKRPRKPKKPANAEALAEVDRN